MTNLNFSFPVDELASALMQKLIPYLPKEAPAQTTPTTIKYLTRKETAVELKISLPTLNEYTKRNLITGYRFGVRVLYKQCEIETALTKMNFGRAGNV